MTEKLRLHTNPKGLQISRTFIYGQAPVFMSSDNWRSVHVLNLKPTTHHTIKSLCSCRWLPTLKDSKQPWTYYITMQAMVDRTQNECSTQHEEDTQSRADFGLMVTHHKTSITCQLGEATSISLTKREKHTHTQWEMSTLGEKWAKRAQSFNSIATEYPVTLIIHHHGEG